MKKICLALALVIALAGAGFAANVTVSIFPVYDWVREISKGVSNDIMLLLDSGIDLHSYQPSAEDIVKISEADLFVYVGGESDEWAENVLKVAAGKNLAVVNLLDVLGDAVKDEEIIDGMEHEHEHGHDDHEHDNESEHDHNNAHEHEHDNAHEHKHAEPDEHVWLSLRNAAIICKKLAAVLSEIDPEHSDIYAENLTRYLEALSSLDEDYASAVKNSARKVILLGDRFPFRYLADDYGLKYYAAFSGCSAESEASFETIIFLAQKVDELNLPCVLKIDGSTHKIAETVATSTKSHGRKILVLDSMQSAAMKDVKAGKTYLGTMRGNLDVLKEALN